MKAVALVACVALLAGCFGYNSSAKRWSYVGDSILVVGGGAAIGVATSTTNPKCTATDGVCPYYPPVSGSMIGGIVLVAAGLAGIIYNITRPTVKTSR
ncbi:MAG TPA: hypothetical protein VMJ10_28655 [Kofleriaceae bacterium]|nr:hypothetical protein [Kofleriaceae bacterium]